MTPSKETVSKAPTGMGPLKKMKNQGIVPKNGVWARNVASAAAADVAALQWCHLRVSTLRAGARGRCRCCILLIVKIECNREYNILDMCRYFR